MLKSSEEVCLAIAADFKMNKISYEYAADLLGQSVQTVYNRLSSKKYFRALTAERWANAFGFNPSFLMYGKGNLRLEPGEKTTLVFPESDHQHPAHDIELTYLADWLFLRVENKDISGMWRAAVVGDKYAFEDCERHLVERIGDRGNLPVLLKRKLESCFSQ